MDDRGGAASAAAVAAGRAAASPCVRPGSCGGLWWPSVLRPSLASPTPVLSYDLPVVAPSTTAGALLVPATAQVAPRPATPSRPPPASRAADLAAWLDAQVGAYETDCPGHPVPRGLLRQVLAEDAEAGRDNGGCGVVHPAPLAAWWVGRAALLARVCGEGGEDAEVVALGGLGVGWGAEFGGDDTSGSADSAPASSSASSASTTSWPSDGASEDDEEGGWGESGRRPRPADVPARVRFRGPGPSLAGLAGVATAGGRGAALACWGGHWISLHALQWEEAAASALARPARATQHPPGAAATFAAVVADAAPAPLGLAAAVATDDGAIWLLDGEGGGLGPGLAGAGAAGPSGARFARAAARAVAPAPAPLGAPPRPARLAWSSQPGVLLSSWGGAVHLVDSRAPPESARASRVGWAGPPVSAIAPPTLHGGCAHLAAVAGGGVVSLYDCRAAGSPLLTWAHDLPTLSPDALAVAPRPGPGAAGVVVALRAARDGAGPAAACLPFDGTSAPLPPRLAATKPPAGRQGGLEAGTLGDAGDGGGERRAKFAWRPAGARVLRAGPPRAVEPLGLGGDWGAGAAYLPPRGGRAGAGDGGALAWAAGVGDSALLPLRWAPAAEAADPVSAPLQPSGLPLQGEGCGGRPAGRPASDLPPPVVRDVRATAACAAAALAAWRAEAGEEETGWGRPEEGLARLAQGRAGRVHAPADRGRPAAPPPGPPSPSSSDLASRLAAWRSARPPPSRIDATVVVEAGGLAAPPVVVRLGTGGASPPPPLPPMPPLPALAGDAPALLAELAALWPEAGGGVGGEAGGGGHGGRAGRSSIDCAAATAAAGDRPAKRCAR